MKRLRGVVCLSAVAFAGLATAHEYPLQYTANGGARGLVVAGYEFVGNTVVGNCSYYTVTSGSGKGGGYHSNTTYYNQTCTWDLYGNLLTVAAGAPAVPAPLYVNGTQTVYAMNSNGGTTGSDSALAGHGFVNTLGSHYTWTTSNAYMVLNTTPYTFTATLASDGDVPLNISAADVGALLGKTTLVSTTCIGTIAVGSTCSVTVTYDARKLKSPSGLAYDTLTLGVASDAGQASDFIQRYTVVVKVSDDD